MAEHLVQDLFIQSGYNVFNFGLERMMPSLSKLLAMNNQKTSRELRFMPDFVVQSTVNGDLFYLEVKFRADGFFAFDDRYTDYPYHNAWFVIVSPGKDPVYALQTSPGRLHHPPRFPLPAYESEIVPHRSGGIGRV